MKVVKLLLIVYVTGLLIVSDGSAGNKCLKYEPFVVELRGTMKRVVFPGPPNYESLKKGDEPEPYWVLYLDSAICVNADPKSQFNIAESNIKTLQLIIGNYDKYRHLLGQRVIVKGMLTHAFTGHHHTSVLVGITDITKAPNKSLKRDAAKRRRAP